MIEIYFTCEMIIFTICSIAWTINCTINLGFGETFWGNTLEALEIFLKATFIFSVFYWGMVGLSILAHL